MKKIVKIILWSLFGSLLLFGTALGIFFYKITNGFPVTYETEKPVIQFPQNQPAILVFSKATAFRHRESIAASLPVFTQMAQRNGWFVYQTEEGGVFNPEQLQQFKAVIFNNSTGRVLNEEQEQALSHYVEAGGALLGIHGAGDNSHHWPWYETNLLGTRFSHHPINPQFQKTEVHIEPAVDTILTQQLPASWVHEDEWYVFLDQPKGARVMSYINGDKINANGNMLWMKNKNFGMGSYHPVAWYRAVDQGKTFYTSMGHSQEVWQDANFVRLVENALQWSMK
ncbi:ThuA domain-containing protein [Adhaeribacter arboris]|uniref:ThuA domain-containing protein n=1 Tax=Adhaeribacter arboris TaxID=2072846 RepID=A0A2T2YNF8_9BACT|nr:ThuA domain-containing protein [Adhaeribacter arboris]PSR57043.1 ThuA domain-containing protein [Adhaeribacter arboris]